MIVRELGDHYTLVRQAEHARMSGVIAAHLRVEFLGEPQEQLDIVRGAAHHDIGWNFWDDSPRFQANGLPINFPDIEKGEHRDCWTRMIFMNLELHGPAAAVFVTRHGEELDDVKENTAVSERRELMKALLARAYPGLSDEEREERKERGFRALFFGDALSLIACAGWDHTLELELWRRGGEPLRCRARRDGDWSVRISPWPFATDEVRKVHVDGVVIPKGMESQCRAILAQPREYRRRLFVDYLPE